MIKINDLFNKPLIIAYLFLILLTSLLLVLSLKNTYGVLTYGLDDPYIHLSMAKNWVQMGRWGVDGYTLSSASSSPLWVLLLAVFKLFLNNRYFLWIPLVLNIIFQMFSLYVVVQWVKGNFQSLTTLHLSNFLVLLSLTTSFVTLTFSGMEHSLQIFLDILIIYLAIQFLVGKKKYQAALLITAPFIPFVRYEGLALLVAISVVLLIKKEIKLAILLIISGLLFIIPFGLWSVHNELYFIPSSILIKSGVVYTNFYSTILGILNDFLNNFFLFKNNTHLITLFTINTLILYFALKEGNDRLINLNLIFIITLFLHLLLGKLSYRYDAYLVLIGVVIVYFYLLEHQLSYEFKLLLPFIILLIPFAIRIAGYPYFIPVTTKNIYEQQFQMAKFLKEYCNNCRVAANDIGAISYFTNIKLLDLVGLGSIEVAKLRMTNQFNNETVNQLIQAHHTELVIIYDDWFPDLKLADFTKIAKWTIQNNKACGSDTVSFYSNNELLKQNLSHMSSFSRYELPAGVHYKLINY
jgi:hypothetical protein